MAAALDHLVAWVKDGKAPPTAPPIDISSAGRRRSLRATRTEIRPAAASGSPALPCRSPSIPVRTGPGILLALRIARGLRSSEARVAVSDARRLRGSGPRGDGKKRQGRIHPAARRRRDDCGGRGISDRKRKVDTSSVADCRTARTCSARGAPMVGVLFLACLSSRAPLRIEPGSKARCCASVTLLQCRSRTPRRSIRLQAEALVFVRQSRGRLTRTYVYQAVRAGNQTIIVTPTNLHDGDCISCVTAHYFVTVVQEIR